MRLAIRTLPVLALLVTSSAVLALEKTGEIRAGEPGAPRRPQVTFEALAADLDRVRIRFGTYNVFEESDPGGPLTNIGFPGCSFVGEVGQPWTPMLTRNIRVHPAERVTVESVEIDWLEPGLDGKLFPTPDFNGPEGKPAPRVFDAEAYSVPGDFYQAYFPSSGDRVLLESAFQVWDETYVPLQLIPLGYEPGTGRIRLVREARITLRRQNRPTSPPDAGSRRKPHPGYLVITPQRFVEGLRPLLNFKRRSHPDLEVITLEEIGSDPRPWHIDPVIEKAAERGTRYVLLVGHASILPGERTASPLGTRGEGCHDGDAIYRTIDLDGIPDVCVGRFPVRDEAELASMVEKTLTRLRHPETHARKLLMAAHEENAPDGYQGNVLGIVENQIPEAAVVPEVELILTAAPDRGGLGSRAGDLQRALRRGVGIFLYRGHALDGHLGTPLLDNFGQHPEHLLSYQQAAPPIFLAPACSTGRMTAENGQATDGLCVRMVTAARGGAVAAVGSVVWSPRTPNDRLAERLVHHIYGDPAPTLGLAFNRALTDVMVGGVEGLASSRDHMLLGALYNLYGDPELPLAMAEN